MRSVFQPVPGAGIGSATTKNERTTLATLALPKPGAMAREHGILVEKLSQGSSMAVPVFLRLSLGSRPPALGPVQRSIPADVQRTLHAWIRDELSASTARVVELSEWISRDSRAVSHTVCIVVEAHRARRQYVIEKASERIVEDDVREALAPRALRADARDAAPA
jgi:hypothetical protein